MKKGSDFSTYISEMTKDFTGRDWVFLKINDWLQTSNQRVFLLTGGPGSGKSALAARLVQMSQGEISTKDYPNLGNGSLTFFHFCQAFNDKTLDPLRFVEALSQQLANHYQPFALALFGIGSQDITINATQTVGIAVDGAEIKNIVIESLNIGNLSVKVAFDRLVCRPLEQLCTQDFKDTIVILVDSLDEALTYDPEENILTLLRDATDHPADLPVNVRFLLTSRRDPRVLNAIGKPVLDLINDAPNGMGEVKDYAYHRLSALHELQSSLLADHIAKASEGNFLYARYVLDYLLQNLDRALDLSSLTLPKGLDDVYRQFLKREIGRNLERWEEVYRLILGVLAVARGEGMTRKQLAGTTGLEQSKTDTILRVFAQYLAGHQPDGPFHIYHSSFRDFLMTDNEYQVYPAEANHAIAHFLMKKYAGDWLNCKDNYALHYTPTHLLEAQMWDELCGVLTNSDFLHAKLDALGVSPKQQIPLSAVFDIIRDFENTLRVLPFNHSMKERISIMLSIITAQQTAFIPSELGFIGPPQGPSSSPTSVIVYIKDAFASYEARKYIVNILERLINQHGLKLILVEGGSGDVSLRNLRYYASKAERIEVAEKYLKNLKIAPEEYLDIVSDYPLIIWGIEDSQLYEKHYQAFMETEALRERLLPTLTSLRQKFYLLKVRWQDRAMADFETKTDAYRKKDLGLADFINYLISIATYHGINPEEYPHLSCFLHVIQLEGFIDFKRAELERNTLVRELVQIMKYAPKRFSYAEIDGFIKRSNEFKEGKITDIDYYIGLERLVLSAGMELDLYNSFSSYLDYLKLNSQIRVPELVYELDRLVERLRIMLVPTPQCKRLVTIDKQLQLIEKLLYHSLMPTDYQDLCGLSFNGIAKDWSSFLEEHLPAQCLSSEEIAQLMELEARLPSCKNDYETANLREEAMIRNTLAKLNETKERIAVLIAGGFHFPKIAEGLKDRGIGILDVTPKISQPLDEKLYLSVLREKHQS